MTIFILKVYEIRFYETFLTTEKYCGIRDREKNIDIAVRTSNVAYKLMLLDN
jgi:hypothetical protein